MGYPRTRPQVLQYMSRRPGVTLWIGDICRELGMSPGQIRSAVSCLIKIDEENIRVVQPAHAWVWLPRGQAHFPALGHVPVPGTEPTPDEPAATTTDEPPAPEPNRPTSFELVGYTRDRDLILQDMAGTLYRATELT